MFQTDPERTAESRLHTPGDTEPTTFEGQLRQERGSPPLQPPASGHEVSPSPRDTTLGDPEPNTREEEQELGKPQPSTSSGEKAQ